MSNLVLWTLKFVISQLRLVLIGQKDFKVCDWPPETILNGQSQILKSCWPLKTSLNWLITNFNIQSQVANHKL